jgi:arylformamidase
MIDISWPISKKTTPYKKRKLAILNFFRTWSKDKARQSFVTLDSHAGTHIDAPAHYLKKGQNIDKIKLKHFVGPCRVLNLTAVKEKITGKYLDKFNIKKDEILLLKTTNSSLSAQGRFESKFVYLDKSGADYLAQKKVRTIGFDYLGIERNQPNHPTHKILLNSKIAIIEGLRLGKVKPGAYNLLCLPLAYKGLEAAPARAVLRR